jgi:acyl-CoA thioesterase-2
MTEPSGFTATDMLQLERVSDTRFESKATLDNGRAAIFGGQPLVQALAAAAQTVAGGWPAHTMSAHFLRGGAPGVPVVYEVEATRDGRRFASRRVRASQDGKAIFDMLCAFHDSEDGAEHQHTPGPLAPPPEGLESLTDFAQRRKDALPPAMAEIYGMTFPVEMRLIDPERVFFDLAEVPERMFWFRMPSAADVADPVGQQCLLAFMSDYWFAGTSASPHHLASKAEQVALVTLNHSLWFHSAIRTDDWLLYRTESPWAGQGRGLVRGTIHDRAGKLLASAVQECSIRPR